MPLLQKTQDSSHHSHHWLVHNYPSFQLPGEANASDLSTCTHVHIHTHITDVHMHALAHAHQLKIKINPFKSDILLEFSKILPSGYLVLIIETSATKTQEEPVYRGLPEFSTLCHLPCRCHQLC